MTKLWRSLVGKTEKRSNPTITIDEWAQMMSYQGLAHALTGTSVSADTEVIENSFIGYINGLYKTNGIVFACMEARRSVFSEARFQFQRINKGRPGDLFGSQALKLLERPWPNGTTGELLSRAIQDVDLSGNHYVVREAGRLRRLRPDWVQIVLTAPPDQAVESDVAGYVYWPGGINNQPEHARIYTTDELSHWSPIPDPEAQYRGMSWLTPILREVQSDKEATEHKAKFYANAATPKLAVSLKETVTRNQFIEFMEAFEAANGGVENAYKTMYLGGGADVSMVGANMVQLDFKAVQGAGETRIAAAAGVPSVVVGFSEGMQGSSLNAGNYKSAKESFAERTLHPLWHSVSDAYESLVKLPADNGTVRLWYDGRDVAFLRTDRKEQADILSINQSTIVGYVTAGFTAESAVAALTAGDESLLVHSGLVSVQLLPPGTQADPATDGVPGTGSPPTGGGVEGKARALVFPWWIARHGTLGDPGYHKLHPGNSGKGQERHPKGGMLGSSDHTPAEHTKALKMYTRKRYIAMNDYLRHRKVSGADVEADIQSDNDTLSDLIDIQDPLDVDQEFWRGTTISLGDFAEGDEFFDKGFVSMAADPIGPRNYFTDPDGSLFKIKVPKGTRGIKVASLGIADPEGEIILRPGTQFRVTKVLPREDGKPSEYELEVVDG